MLTQAAGGGWRNVGVQTGWGHVGSLSWELGMGTGMGMGMQVGKSVGGREGDWGVQLLQDQPEPAYRPLKHTMGPY